MKHFNFALLSYLLLANGYFIPLEVAPSFGVLAYETKPVNISQEFSVILPFYSSRTFIYEYYYHVLNPLGVNVYSYNNSHVEIGAQETYYITFKGRASWFVPGHSRIVLFYRMKGSENYIEHHSSFFGYEPGVTINLNDEEEARTKFATEVTFIYDGYREKTVSFHKTQIYFDGLQNIVYYEHDLKLDLTKTYIRTNTIYPANFYEEMHFFFGAHEAFPYYEKLSLGAYLPMKLENNGKQINVVPSKTIYIDPQTQFSRTFPKPGFILTDKFYFPKYHYDVINNAVCRLQVKKFGYSQFNLEYTFKIEVGRPFIAPDGHHQAVIVRY